MEKQNFIPRAIDSEMLANKEILLPAQQKIMQMAEQVQSLGGPTLADYLSDPENLERFAQDFRNKGLKGGF